MNLITQEELTELREIWKALRQSDYRQIEAVGINTAVSHSLKQDARFLRLGQILEGIRWDDLTVWKHNH